MKCYRCNGTMVSERFYLWHEHFSGWRCVTCGEIVDPVIMKNRGKPKEAARISRQLRAVVEERSGF